MRITLSARPLSEQSAELLAIALPKAESKAKSGTASTPPRRSPSLPRAVASLDHECGGVIANALRSGDFEGAVGERLAVYPPAGSPVRRLLLVGLGKVAELDAECLRRVAARTAREAEKRRVVGRVALWIPRAGQISARDTVAAATEGFVLGAYRFDRYRAAQPGGRRDLKSVRLVAEGARVTPALRRAVSAAQTLAQSQNLARDLSNEPANELPPSALASAARRLAREVGLRCRVLRGAQLEREGFGALLAVGGGSAHPPQLIVLEHDGRPAGTKRRGTNAEGPICLIGKGITFDAGGLSLKPSTNMGDMKHDMSGAAAVLGVMRAIGQLGLPLRVVGVVAAAENMPGGNAYRPGDIVRSLSGKTIEVVNTDAEGRLVLADALHYARKRFRPRAMVDIATLTGAAMVALGPWATAALGRDEKMVESLRRAGAAGGERVWPMPLLPEHGRAMKSRVADLKNTGGRDAGVSTAAAFLAEFVGDTPWVHLDIAGTGWTGRTNSYHRGGATGVGVRLLVTWLRDQSERD